MYQVYENDFNRQAPKLIGETGMERLTANSEVAATTTPADDDDDIW